MVVKQDGKASSAGRRKELEENGFWVALDKKRAERLHCTKLTNVTCQHA